LLSASAQQRAELQKADIVEDAIALDYWNMTLSGEDLPENLNDPIVLAAIRVVLLVVTIAAALIPARHAALIEPASALRVD